MDGGEEVLTSVVSLGLCSYHLTTLSSLSQTSDRPNHSASQEVRLL